MRRHHIGSARSCGGLTVESDGASWGKNRRASRRLKRRVVLAARGRCSSFAERRDSADYPICSSSSAEIVTRGTSRKATETTRIDCGRRAMIRASSRFVTAYQDNVASLVSHRRATSSHASAIWRKMARSRSVLAVLAQSKHSSAFS